MLRSEFLCTTTVASVGALCGAASVSTFLSGCASSKYVDGTQTGGIIMVPLTDFVSGDTTTPSLIVRKSGAMKGPIHVVRSADGTYSALSLVCTHKGCIVRPVGTGFECPCHGSEFNADGSVLSAPAKEPLVRYAVTTDATHLHIKL